MIYRNALGQFAKAPPAVLGVLALLYVYWKVIGGASAEEVAGFLSLCVFAPLTLAALGGALKIEWLSSVSVFGAFVAPYAYMAWRYQGSVPEKLGYALFVGTFFCIVSLPLAGLLIFGVATLFESIESVAARSLTFVLCCVPLGIAVHIAPHPLPPITRGNGRDPPSSTPNTAQTADASTAPSNGTDDAWSRTASGFTGSLGRSFTLQCPAGGSVHPTWGTGVYTADSSVCTAAVHVGRITLANGGAVTFEMRRGRNAYRGSTRNGVVSRAYGRYRWSFAIR